MSISEALIKGSSTIVVGMVTVFAVLAILMIAIQIMKNVFYKAPEEKSEKKTEEVPVNTPVQAQPEGEEEEHIAVLTAAVAASLNTSTYNLKIKSYRRIETRNPPWNRAAIRENTNLSL